MGRAEETLRERSPSGRRSGAGNNIAPRLSVEEGGALIGWTTRLAGAGRGCHFALQVAESQLAHASDLASLFGLSEVLDFLPLLPRP